ncbi:hypothetical protein AB6A40_007224 [Gnathostoma spinigerum]|uniref:Uncharacterized protein n=1 Tax=Gnathostoma spinigerum TaxID=75299 RepID=A0ABD6ELU4_9BILA
MLVQRVWLFNIFSVKKKWAIAVPVTIGCKHERVNVNNVRLSVNVNGRQYKTMSSIEAVDESRSNKIIVDADRPKHRTTSIISYTHFEEVLERINPFGKFQIFACICICIASIHWAGNHAFTNELGSIEPIWECRSVNNESEITRIQPPTNDEKCTILKNNCSEYWSEPSNHRFHSIVSVWKLICSEKNKQSYILIFQSAGCILGSVLGGHIGDYFGRKPGFYAGQLCLIVTSIMTTAAVSWLSFAICRFVSGMFYGMIEVTSLTLMVEYTSNKFRLIPIACFQWAIPYIVMALIAFLTEDWQWYLVFLNLFTAPIALGFTLFFESPRWLITSNQLDKASEVLNDIASHRWNNRDATFTANDLNLIPRDSYEKKKFYNVLHLFSSRRLVKQTFMQLLSMFTYGLTSNTFAFSIIGGQGKRFHFVYF